MPNLPISGLPTASALDGTELLPFVQGGVTTQANVQDILDADLPLTSSGITLSGDIVPATPQGANLGSLSQPFREIFLQSGSLNIESDTPGDPSAIISNFNGNVDIKAAGFSVTSGSISPFIINNQGQVKIQNKYQDPQNEAIFQVIGNNEGSQSTAVNPGNMIHITGFDGVPNRNVFDSYGGGGVFSQVILRNAAGAAANPTSTVAGIIGRVATSGYITDIGFGIQGVTGPPASMNFYTPGYRSGSRETMIRFYATADNELDPNGYSAVIKAEGMEVTGSVDVSGSFNATTGSFQYQTGSLVYEGEENFTGSLNITGSLTLGPNTPLNINNGFYVDGNKQFNYGAFSSTVTQSGSADTILSMSFDTTDIGGAGVSIVNGTEITVANTGIYNLQFSAQLDRTTSGTNIATIWFAYTGSSIANSATDVTIAGSAASNPIVAAWNYILPMVSGSYVEIYWSHNDNVDDKVELKAVAPRINPTRPAVPSIIATLTQVA